jgi:hypothetical protein
VSVGDEQASGPRPDFARRLMTAATGTGEQLKPLVHDASEDVLRALAANPALDEDDLLLLLARRDLPSDLLRQVANDTRRTASYRVRLALLRQPRTPASASLRFVPQLHLFDLVAVSLLPHAPREVKASAEGAILAQVKTLPLGVRITLARRAGSEAILARLLVDHERPVVEAVVLNGRLTEGTVVRALRDRQAPAHTVDVVSSSSRWSPRHDVRFALLRSRHLPLGRALTCLSTMTRADISLLASDPAVPTQLRAYLGRREEEGGRRR